MKTVKELASELEAVARKMTEIMCQLAEQDVRAELQIVEREIHGHPVAPAIVNIKLWRAIQPDDAIG